MSDSSEEGDSERGIGERGVGGLKGPWIEGFLTSHHGSPVTLIDWAIRPGPQSPDQPVLSDILSLTAHYQLQSDPDDHKTLSLIVKLLPLEPFQRYFVTEAQFDLREINFYTKVVEDIENYSKEVGHPLELPIAKLYHAHYTAGAEPPTSPAPPLSSVLVLEDLTTAGYTVPEFSKGLNLAQAESALRAVAVLHAASLGLKLKTDTPLDKTYPFLFQTARATDSYQQLVERGLPQLASFLENRPGTEGLMTALKNIQPTTKELISSLLEPKEPLGLITHTDFWCNNLAFTDDETPKCKILDWQMVTYSRGTNDLALLILSSIPTDLRRSSTNHLLDVYWDEFSNLCSKLSINLNEIGYTREILGSDYRDSQLLTLLLCIGSVDVALGNPTTEQRLHDLLQDLYEDGILNQHAV